MKSTERAEALQAAAKLIEKHGWAQHFNETPKGALCMRGAINKAIVGDPWLYSRRAKPTLDFMSAFLVETGRCEKETRGYPEHIYWNDLPTTTKADVLAALREAASK